MPDKRNTTPFIEFANRQLFPTVDAIVRTVTNEGSEKAYIQGLKQAFTLLQAGEAAELVSAIDEKNDRMKTEGALNASALDFEYSFSVQIDGRYYADLRIPNFDRVPAQARAYAFQLADQGEKHIPDYLKTKGRSYKVGVRLYHRGQWVAIYGFGLDKGFLLNNQLRECQAYTKRYPNTQIERVDYNQMSYTVIKNYQY